MPTAHVCRYLRWKGFKQAMNDGEHEEEAKQLKQDKDADFDTAAKREADAKTPPKTNA